jgi:hypothetical protein
VSGNISEVVKVARVDIVKNPEWQLREKLNATRVKHYRSVYKLGASMPPITLADVKGTLYLIDGWHRCEAQTELGWSHFDATIISLTKSEAQWQAASANLTHGESYKKPERRKAFNVFISTKQNKAGGGKLMSYREMAVAFGGDPTYVTIRSWVKADHPLLFKALEKSKGDWSPDMVEPNVGPTEEQRILERLHSLLVDVVALSKSIESTACRESLKSMATKAFEAIIHRKAYAATPVAVDSDF